MRRDGQGNRTGQNSRPDEPEADTAHARRSITGSSSFTLFRPQSVVFTQKGNYTFTVRNWRIWANSRGHLPGAPGVPEVRPARTRLLAAGPARTPLPARGSHCGAQSGARGGGRLPERGPRGRGVAGCGWGRGPSCQGARGGAEGPQRSRCLRLRGQSGPLSSHRARGALTCPSSCLEALLLVSTLAVYTASPHPQALQPGLGRVLAALGACMNPTPSPIREGVRTAPAPPARGPSDSAHRTALELHSRCDTERPPVERGPAERRHGTRL